MKKFLKLKKVKVDGASYSYIKKRDVSAILVLCGSEHTILMVSQFRIGSYMSKDMGVSEFSEIPAGHIEKGESPVQAAVRELQEETGLNAAEEDLKSLGAYYSSPGWTTERVHLFLYKIKKGDLMKIVSKTYGDENIFTSWVEKESVFFWQDPKLIIAWASAKNLGVI